MTLSGNCTVFFHYFTSLHALCVLLCEMRGRSFVACGGNTRCPYGKVSPALALIIFPIYFASIYQCINGVFAEMCILIMHFWGKPDGVN